jgi:arginine decarboxylase
MKNRYLDLIEQTFYFPQPEFTLEEDNLLFHGIPLMEIIKQYGTPVKLTYLPKISEQIKKARKLFNVAMAKVDYQGEYHYAYCTKSSHFSFVMDEILKNNAHIETSSAFDINLVESLISGK